MKFFGDQDPDREPIVIQDYDPAWPAMFEELAEPVRGALVGMNARVEHVGSTAVPGLAAKEVIDMDVVVASPQDVPEAVERLGRLGYLHRGDLGIRGREAFAWPPGSRRHHLYVVPAGSEPFLNHLRFRDHLRSHTEDADAYAALKRLLAQTYRTDRARYTDAKSAFIGRILGG
ncbi:MAG: GrpB family protein [Actinomycetota bacterium]|nr:GrpB family protein [Actinomycetota bacterium]